MMILLSITIYFSTFFLLLFWVMLDCIFKQLYVNYKGKKRVRKLITPILSWTDFLDVSSYDNFTPSLYLFINKTS